MPGKRSILINVLIFLQQEVANSLAKLSVRALSRLGGYLPEEQATPENPTIRKSLAGMLTPYVARKLAVISATEVCASELAWVLINIARSFT